MYKYKKLKLKDGSTIDEHRHVMQQHLGRKLTCDEIVHHKDGNFRNNNIDNLEIMSKSEHAKLHCSYLNLHTEEAIKKNADARKGKPVWNSRHKDDILKIRAGWAFWDSTLREYANRWEMRHSNMSNIINGVTYKYM